MDSWLEDVEINISRGIEGCRSEDESKEKGYDDAQHVKAVRPKLRSSAQAEEGSVKRLVRPPLPGRKSHRKTSNKDSRGAWSPENQDFDEQIPISSGKLRQKKAGRFLRDRAQEKWEEGTPRSLQRSRSSVELFGAWDFGESFNSSQRGHNCSRPLCVGCSQTNNISLSAQSLQPTMKHVSSSPSESPFQSRLSPPSPQRLSPKKAQPSSPREPDNSMEVKAGATTGQLSRHQSLELGEDDDEEEEQKNGVDEDENLEDEEEGAHGVTEVISHTVTPAGGQTSEHAIGRKTSNKENNRSNCRRRRQRRHEVWRQSPCHEKRQSSTGNTCSSRSSSSSSSSSSSDDGDISPGDKEGYICAVCLDVYFSPYMCHPCNHIFCEPCLRTLAKNSPTNTPCPLCRTVITHVFFQKELNQTARTFFPNEYLSRKQNFQRTSYSKWPLPSCRRFFRIFGSFQRPSSPTARRQFSHRGSYHLDAIDFQGDSRRWGFDMDMVIIYIHSVNWIIAFFIFGFLCYLFFSTF